MFEKEVKSDRAKYVSCIKINGMPILPPLLTNAKRKEIHRYRQQAIKLEKRLKRERELRQYIDRYYTPSLEKNVLLNSTLEHKLSFEDDITSQISAIENELKEITLTNEVPSIRQRKSPCLSCDLQVSQYTNNEFTVLTCSGKCSSDVVITNKYWENKTSIENSKDDDVDTCTDSQRPRLVRSNSYVLESPSPMLIDHLRKQQELSNKQGKLVLLPTVCNEQTLREEQSNISNVSTPKARDNEYIFYEKHDDAEHSIYTDISKTESELRNISTCFSDAISNDDEHSFLENQSQLKAFIDNNVPQIPNKECEYTKENENLTNSYSKEDKVTHKPNVNLGDNSGAVPAELSSYDEQSLKQILNSIPDMYSKKILELLEKQKQEQLLNLHDNVPYCEQYKLEDIRHILPEKKLLSDLYVKKQSSLSGDSSEISDKFKDVSELRPGTTLSCSRELFPIDDKGVKPLNKQEYAASIIAAAAKGYLVRRLMRTERVQGLIQTIREALICAMQLHLENTENINESDVELHRRLIQQVSAACFEFYDVFFTLSTSERMTIIKQDRERQKEKLKRPLSRISSASQSSRSSRSLIK